MFHFKTKFFKLSHLSFSLLFTTLTFIVWNFINFEKIAKWFKIGDATDILSLTCFFMFGLGFYITFFLLFAHRWTIKPFSILFLVLSAASAYFISKYNVAIDSTMVMNTLHTDVTEASSLLSVHMLSYFIFLVILPIYLLLKIDITFKGTIRYLASSFIVMILSLVIGLGLAYTKFDSILQAANISNKYIIHSLVPFNYIRSILSVVQKTVEPYYLKQQKEPIITGKVATQKDLTVVLAIGESSRQKSFSLYGYQGNNTNPLLSQVEGLYTLNGIARLGSTLYALPEILTKGYTKLASVTSKLGVKTACYVNFQLYGNCNAVGEVNVSNCGHGGQCYDEDVIPLLEKNLANYSSGSNFVILHLGGGSHGPTYKDRHPPEFQKFKPQCLDADVVNQCSVEELYNSYDNTILYVDYVLNEIIKKLDESKSPYVLIYLSDHGESLLENGRIFHGMPPGIKLPDEQAHIPLLVKSSFPINIIKRDEYKQQDVYDTVLDLFSIETKTLDKSRVFVKVP